MFTGKETTESDPLRLSLIGTRASGKSTCIGLLNLTAMDMVRDRQRAGRTDSLRLTNARINELNSTIRDVVGNLNHGVFPEPTPSNQTFTSSLVLEFEPSGVLGRVLGNQAVAQFKQFKRFMPAPRIAELTITDVAGETVGDLMTNFERGEYDLPDSHVIEEVSRYILRSNAFVLIVDTEDLYRSATNRGPEGSHSYQDVALARFVDSLETYKRNNRGLPPIQSVALIGTKYDAVRNEMGISHLGNLESREGMARFMDNFLPQTWMSLHNIVDGNRLNVFFSEVEMARSVDGEAPRIRTEEGRLRPVYSVDEYKRLIDWIGDLAA